MAADDRRHVVVMGLEVTDDAAYARYREGMTPTLAAYGGAFDFDFIVARVLRSPGSARINRLFAISFPDRATCERFFVDPSYLDVRREHFEPAVASATRLLEVEGTVG